jgi:DUF1365 family protein
MKSCIYEGQVRHRRFTPRTHEFDYSLFLMYVDLDESPSLFDNFWLWSGRRFNMAWLNRKDHMGASGSSLSDEVRSRIQAATGIETRGPIRLLTHFRYFGFGFNPVSFYYCFDEHDKNLETIVCEVNNTPWGEQHIYVLSEQDNIGKGSSKIYHKPKEFHVSPFMPMDMEYNWSFNQPAEKLNVHMVNYREQEKIFDATLTLKRSPITSFHLARVLVQYPWVTLKVVVAIYFQALRLWLKKIPLHSHPDDNKEAPKQASKS